MDGDDDVDEDVGTFAFCHPTRTRRTDLPLLLETGTAPAPPSL